MNENAPDLVHEEQERRLLCTAIESLARAGAEPQEIERQVRMLRGYAPSHRRMRTLSRAERPGRAHRRPLWRLVTGM
jgi:hypothetical protein